MFSCFMCREQSVKENCLRIICRNKAEKMCTKISCEIPGSRQDGGTEQTDPPT